MGCSPAYLLKPTHGDIAVADRQYQDNVYDYHLVKNMNSTLKKIVVEDIREQWIKGAKYMVMVYAKMSFVEFMDCLYLRYGHITPGDLMRNKEDMQGTYNAEDPINIMFDQIDIGQEFAVERNSQFSDWQLVDMGVTKIMALQE